MGQTVFKVTGMDCAEETNALRRTVGALSGVTYVTFNLLNGTMTVAAAEDIVDDGAVLAAVARAGMTAQRADEVSQAEAAGVRLTDSRAILCAASGLAVAAGFLSHWFLHTSILDALAEGGANKSHLLPVVSILFYLAAIISGGWFIFPKAVAAVRNFRADMNLLMTIAVIGAVAIGEWLEAATVTFLFSLSLLLEAWSLDRARSAVKALFKLTPPRARYICPHDGDIMEKPVEDVPLGVTVLVRPGERIPLDGMVTKGHASVNQAPITGEAAPVEKREGDEVFAGTINEDGAIEFSVTRPAADTAIARVIRMVEEAQARRSIAEQWVEKFAGYYTPIMIVIAVALSLVSPLLFGNWTHWFYQSLVILVIACPCALVIATPVSVVSALAAAARAGVLVKGGSFLEEAGRIKVVALDKTGTVTRGRPDVQKIIPLNGHSGEELLDRAAALEQHSRHPLARAIVVNAHRLGRVLVPVENYREFRGQGAQGTIDGRNFWIGSRRLLQEKKLEDDDLREKIEALEDAGHSVVVVGNDKHVCGLISVADVIRAHALTMVADLKRAGVENIFILTGDNRGTAEAVSKKIGADAFYAELLPEDKMAAVEDMKRRYGHVAMVGDGINDAPALAAATLGIAMGAAGTDAALETADIALMSDDLSRLSWLIRHGRRTLGVIRTNIFFALSVKIIFMGLAIVGYATLWMAIAADMGASLLVIMNALRLLKGTRDDRRLILSQA